MSLELLTIGPKAESVSIDEGLASRHFSFAFTPDEASKYKANIAEATSFIAKIWNFENDRPAYFHVNALQRDPELVPINLGHGGVMAVHPLALQIERLVDESLARQKRRLSQQESSKKRRRFLGIF